MKTSLSLKQKALILVAVPLLFEFAFVATMAFLLKRAEHEIWRERHSRAVVSESNSLLKNFLDCAFALYMYGNTGGDIFLERYKELNDQIHIQIRSLKIMLRDSPHKKESLLRLEAVSNRATQLLAQGGQIVDDNRALSRLKEDREGLERILEELTAELRAFVRAQEKAEQIDPQAEVRTRFWLMQCLIVGITFNVVLAFFLAVSFNRSTTRRLHILMDNTERLPKGQPLNELVAGGDELARLDLVFHQMAKALAEAATRKQELVSMVSHDLRTPLTSVRASLTMLSEGVFGELSGRAQKEVNTAENNAARLIHLINDLLDIERIESGQMCFIPCAVSVQSLFEQAVETVGAFAEQNAVTINITSTDLIIYADPDRVTQILINLLSNSIKFSPPQSSVSLRADQEEQFVKIQVVDSGRGVPEGLQKTIFGRFQQVEDSDAKEKQGSGLGLAICKSLVDLHGGRIGVDSREGLGSNFWFLIPRIKID